MTPAFTLDSPAFGGTGVADVWEQLSTSKSHDCAGRTKSVYRDGANGKHSIDHYCHMCMRCFDNG